MKIVFVSNYFNHHQKPLSDAFDSVTSHEYTFVKTGEMREERKMLGYKEELGESYIITRHAHAEACNEMTDSADVVLIGSAPEECVSKRIKEGKLTFRYSERPLKNGSEIGKFIPRLIKWRRRNPKNKPVYLLAASAYAPYDYSKFGIFKNKAYKWGYFTETKHYDIKALSEQKNRKKILWAARFIGLKHPEYAISLAKKLKDSSAEFELDMIGIGEEEENIKNEIKRLGLESHVTLCGAMSPEEVRGRMEEAGIFIFTADRREGWGAVINEAMNSGCAVVACSAAGSVPYLVKDGINGFSFGEGDEETLFERVRELLCSPDLQKELGERAYETITSLWNAECAAERLVKLSGRIASGEKHPALYEEGPCSPAGIIKG